MVRDHQALNNPCSLSLSLLQGMCPILHAVSGNSISEVQASCYVPSTSLFYHKYNTPDPSGFSMLPAVSFGKLTTLAFPQTSVFPHHLILKICFLDPAGKSHAGKHYACVAIHCSLDILFPHYFLNPYS